MKIKSMDELQTLDKAVFKGELVVKSEFGFWYEQGRYGDMLHSTHHDIEDITNWEYFEESKADLKERIEQQRCEIKELRDGLEKIDLIWKDWKVR